MSFMLRHDKKGLFKQHLEIQKVHFSEQYQKSKNNVTSDEKVVTNCSNFYFFGAFFDKFDFWYFQNVAL